MSETENISKMADKAAKDIFSVFGWELRGPRNSRWECKQQDRHKRKKSKVHPSDAVYRYADPHLGRDLYLSTDFKSYGTATVKSFDLPDALKELGRATECANNSPGFRELYVDSSRLWKAVGLLFIFNHDGHYDADFEAVLENILPSAADLAANDRLYVIGPQRVLHLYNIAKNITLEQAPNGLLDSSARIEFCYPNLQTIHFAETRSRVASIEMLLSPWQVVRYEKEDDDNRTSIGHIIYYDGGGDSEDEFQYLLDYLFQYQLEQSRGPVSVRLPNAASQSSAIFEKAKELYAREYWPISKFPKEVTEKRMKNIVLDEVTEVYPRFSEVQIGMEARRV